MNLYVWARKWGIPDDAVMDLRLQMGIDPSQPQDVKPVVLTSESGVQQHTRLAYAKAGALLWRNNVGSLQDSTGRWVRYGLANESKGVNDKVKSSDLIGIQPVSITRDMVGGQIGQFVAIECKDPGWKYSGQPREIAQKRFLELVISRGGSAKFTNGVDDTVTRS